MRKSKTELLFEAQLQDAGILNYVTELRFDKVRKWRWDFAFPELRLAIELEGGVYSGGRHTTGKGFESDCEKYAEGTLVGWTILRIPGTWVNSDDLKALRYTQRFIEYLGKKLNN